MWLPPLTLLIAAACAPADAQDAVAIPRHRGPESLQAATMDYDPVDVPLSWTGGELVVAHREMYNNGADVYMSFCPGSGFYAVPVAGGEARPISVGDPACRAVRDDGDGVGVAVHATGGWAVFSESTPPNNSRLSRLDLRTGRVDSLPTGCAVYLGDPSLSPDGRRIAAVGQCRDRQQDPFGLYAMDSDGSGLRKIADDPGAAAAWSPDGQRLAATLDGGIVVMAADGSGRRAVGSVERPGDIAEAFPLLPIDVHAGEHVLLVEAEVPGDVEQFGLADVRSVDKLIAGLDFIPPYGNRRQSRIGWKFRKQSVPVLDAGNLLCSKCSFC